MTAEKLPEKNYLVRLTLGGGLTGEMALWVQTADHPGQKFEAVDPKDATMMTRREAYQLCREDLWPLGYDATPERMV
jgi:hypothetical protein